MKLIDLINNTSWEEIEENLLKYYGYHFEKYKKRIIKKKINIFKSAFNELLITKPKPTKIRILITKVIVDDEIFADVSGLDGSLVKDDKWYNPKVDEKYANDEIYYSICFTHWGEWVNMEIENASLEFTNAEIVTHCLWELTFHRYSQLKEDGLID